jgi:hypothetical protein
MTNDLEMMTFDPFTTLGDDMATTQKPDEWLVVRKAAGVDAKTEVTPARIIADLCEIPTKDLDEAGYWYHHEDKLVARAADALSDWVLGYLTKGAEGELQPLIQRMVATAMMMQHKNDREMIDYETQLRDMTDARLSQEWQRVEDALAFESGPHGKHKYFMSAVQEMEQIERERDRRH